MSIKHKQGNLLDARGIIVHGCNCIGAMGAGVALAIRKKWPVVYNNYVSLHKQEGLQLGEIQPIHVSQDVVVINAMTQQNVGTHRQQVDYSALRECFNKVHRYAIDNGISVVNFPLIGCGLAGGDWGTVSAIIDSELGDSLEKVLWTL